MGTNYKDPVLTIGVGDKQKQIGTATTDADGRLISVNIDTPVLGFVKPEIVDSQGTGARLSTSYIYTSPREIKETNVLPLTQYIDCVGHPMITFKEEDEDASLQDSGFNLVDGQDTATTTDGDTTTVSTPTVADPVTTPVNPSTPTETPSAPSTPTPPSTPPSSPPQNNPPQQGGYGGY